METSSICSYGIHPSRIQLSSKGKTREKEVIRSHPLAQTIIICRLFSGFKKYMARLQR